MSEETQADSTVTRPAATADSSKEEAVAFVAEQPVPSAPQKKTAQYVVTVDNQTGLLVKIEKLDDVKGERKELSQEEYEQVMMGPNLSSSSFDAGLDSNELASTTENSPLLVAYYRGVADYLNALT